MATVMKSSTARSHHGCGSFASSTVKLQIRRWDRNEKLSYQRSCGRGSGQGRAGSSSRGSLRPADLFLALVAGGGLMLAALAIGALVALIRTRPRREKSAQFHMSEIVTPFSVLGLLREIEHKNGLTQPDAGAEHVDPGDRAPLLRQARWWRTGPQEDRRDLGRPGFLNESGWSSAFNLGNEPLNSPREPRRACPRGTRSGAGRPRDRP